LAEGRIEMKLIRVKCADDNIVEDINVGKEINKFYRDFHAIKTQKQFDAWAARVKAWRTGTYQNQDLVSLLFHNKDWVVQNPSSMQKEFLDSIKRILK
jgi:hypothetical protein